MTCVPPRVSNLLHALFNNAFYFIPSDNLGLFPCIPNGTLLLMRCKLLMHKSYSKYHMFVTVSVAGYARQGLEPGPFEPHRSGTPTGDSMQAIFSPEKDPYYSGYTTELSPLGPETLGSLHDTFHVNCIAVWLGARGRPPLGFVMPPSLLANLANTFGT